MIRWTAPAFRCVCAALMLSLAPWTAVGAFAANEVIDRVLAVAEGQVITLSDVRIARELGRVDVRLTVTRGAFTEVLHDSIVPRCFRSPFTAFGGS